MIVSGIVKTSLLDFPGKIATVLFTPGCNYDCYYCHNRKIIQDLDKILDLSEIEDFLQNESDSLMAYASPEVNRHSKKD